MLAEPTPTPYDLRFNLLGFDVRISPWFWLAAVLLGWSISQPDVVAALTRQEAQFGAPLYLALWTAAMFISILIHELGHALAFRQYGVSSHIVLYHFGGLAVPDGGHGYGFSRFHPRQDMIVAAAGPAAQLLLAAIILLLVRVAGHSVPLEAFWGRWWPDLGGTAIPNQPLAMFALYLLLPSILWALMNLLPVLPLDGGQIAAGYMKMHDPARGPINALWLSVFVGAAVAVLALMFLHDKMMAMLFGILAVQNYMTLQMFGGGGYGGRPW
jgi:Zn-dependent protease